MGRKFNNSEMILVGRRKDKNGNQTVKLNFKSGRGFSIQTNGNLPETHRILQGVKKLVSLSEEDMDVIKNEIYDYVKENGTKRQKELLKNEIENTYEIFEGKDHKNDKPLYQVKGKGEYDDYVGEWHDNREDAKEELDDLLRSEYNKGDSTYAKGGSTYSDGGEIGIGEYVWASHITSDASERIPFIVTGFDNGVYEIQNVDGDIYDAEEWSLEAATEEDFEDYYDNEGYSISSIRTFTNKFSEDGSIYAKGGEVKAVKDWEESMRNRKDIEYLRIEKRQALPSGEIMVHYKYNPLGEDEYKGTQTGTHTIKYAKGGEVEDKFEVKLNWKGLSNDRTVGEYIITEKTLDELEEQWSHIVSIDVLDYSTKEPISWFELKKELFSKGRDRGLYAKGGEVECDFSINPKSKSVRTILFNSTYGRKKAFVKEITSDTIHFTDGTSIPNCLNSEKYEIEEINGEQIWFEKGGEVDIPRMTEEEVEEYLTTKGYSKNEISKMTSDQKYMKALDYDGSEISPFINTYAKGGEITKNEMVDSWQHGKWIEFNGKKYKIRKRAGAVQDWSLVSGIDEYVLLENPETGNYFPLGLYEQGGSTYSDGGEIGIGEYVWASHITSDASERIPFIVTGFDNGVYEIQNVDGDIYDAEEWSLEAATEEDFEDYYDNEGYSISSIRAFTNKFSKGGSVHAKGDSVSSGYFEGHLSFLNWTK